MAIQLSECLFSKDYKSFKEIENKANNVLLTAPMFRLIGSNLKAFIKNYATQHGVHLKILYLPFNDEQVWGLFYQRNGIYFIVINSEISINKQNVALAHEFYHFIVALEEDFVYAMDILKDIGGKVQLSLEDQKANAFSSCLLMPADLINLVFTKEISTLEEKIVSIKALMDIFVVPYKTAVIRLYELGKLTFEDAQEFIKSINSKTRNDLEKINFAHHRSRWEHPIKNYVDLDDLSDLINENENYEFISSNKASRCKNKVEEIIQKLLKKEND